MGTTPKYALRYPELTDPPDGAGQMKNLATDVETTIDGGTPWVQFRNTLASNNLIGTNTAVYQTWARIRGYQDPFVIRAGDATFLDCVKPGAYQILYYQKVNCPTVRSTGFCQIVVEIPKGTSRQFGLANQGGSTFIDVFAHLPWVFGASSSASFYFGNSTGANVGITVDATELYGFVMFRWLGAAAA